MSSNIDNTQNCERKSTIVEGFKWGLGASAAAVVVGGAVGAAKAALVYKSTVSGAGVGMAMGGPAGAVVGGTLGAAAGMLV